MNQEIELKLQLYPQSIEPLKNFMQQYPAPQNQFLANTYYDSPDNLLAKNKMGLRIRQQDKELTLTLKTEGNIVGGLHQRPEYNLALQEDNVDLNRLCQRYAIELPCPQENIQMVFRTDFNRSIWLVTLDNHTEIEVALDEGKILTKDKQTPICELELELKQGTVNDLLDFVRQLPLENLFFCSSSKAKRGYLLAGISNLNYQDWATIWDSFTTLENTQKIKKLLQIEQHLIEDLFLFDTSYFSNSFSHTLEYIMSFFNIFNFYKENAYLITEQISFLPPIQQQYFEQLLLLELLENNQIIYEKIKEIILQHSQTKNNQQAIKSLQILLSSKEQNLRLLALMILNINSNKEA